MYELKNGRLILHGKTPPIYWTPDRELEVLDVWTNTWKPVLFVAVHGGLFILGDVTAHDLSSLPVREKQNA